MTAQDIKAGYGNAFFVQWRVIFALMLRNVRTRFFGHGLGFLIALAWPLTHILLVVAVFSAAGRAPPLGESTILFVATGSAPFMAFSYMSRFMLFSTMTAKCLLSFPIVTTLDILFASALVEMLSSCCVLLVLIALALLFNIDPMPQDIVEACFAFGAALLVGLGFGLFNGVVALAMPGWNTVYALTNIVLWMTAGVYFVPDTLPEPMFTMASYHPVLQVVEWMRAGYYGSAIGAGLLDKQYVLEVGFGMIFFGLILERGMRGFILSQR